MDYRKHYNNLINRGKSRILTGYTESHHIVPRCLHGTDDKSNLVDLTPEEHYVAHQLLVKIYPGHSGLVRACRMMCSSSKSQVRNNKEFGWIKKRLNTLPGPMTGKTHSDETKIKMSKASKGKPKSKEHRLTISKIRQGVSTITDAGRQKIIDTHTGKYVSEDTRSKMSEGIKNINIVVSCPWCGKEGKLTGMKSWHFDRCKENPNGLQRTLHTSKQRKV